MLSLSLTLHIESIVSICSLTVWESMQHRAEKTSVLSTLIQKTNAQEMKWVIRIILKGRKFSASSHKVSIFHFQFIEIN